jgi:hypothetical protein
VLERDVSHPCIVAWVPFNESWGVPGLERSAAPARPGAGAVPPHQGDDPDRPGIGNDGLGEHRGRLPRRPRLRAGPRAPARAPAPSPRTAPLARALLRPPRAARRGRRRGRRCCSRSSAGSRSPRPTENGATWGYDRVHSSEEFLRRYKDLLGGGARTRPRPASATRSWPTPTRRPTACSPPSGSPRRRWRSSPPPRAAPSAWSSRRSRPRPRGRWSTGTCRPMRRRS